MPTLPLYETAVRGKLLHKEIRRLHCEIYEIMRRLPGAKRRYFDRSDYQVFRDVPGDELVCDPPLLEIVTIDGGVSGVSNYMWWVVRLRIGRGATWGQIVELIIHELAHCLNPGYGTKDRVDAWERALPVPQRLGHNPAFWELVVAASKACYDVSTIPVMPGDKRYTCDDRLVRALYMRHKWANIRVNLTGTVVAELRQRQERLAAQAAKDAERHMRDEGVPLDVDVLLVD